MSGVAIALTSADPSIRLSGVSVERGAVVAEGLRAGRLVELAEEPTPADGLAGALPQNNRYTFCLCQRYVDEAVLVSETEIAQAMAFARDEQRLGSKELAPWELLR